MPKYICVSEETANKPKQVISVLKGENVLRRGDFDPLPNTMLRRVVFRSLASAEIACGLLNEKFNDNFKPIETK